MTTTIVSSFLHITMTFPWYKSLLFAVNLSWFILFCLYNFPKTVFFKSMISIIFLTLQTVLRDLNIYLIIVWEMKSFFIKETYLSILSSLNPALKKFGSFGIKFVSYWKGVGILQQVVLVLNVCSYSSGSVWKKYYVIMNIQFHAPIF